MTRRLVAGLVGIATIFCGCGIAGGANSSPSTQPELSEMVLGHEQLIERCMRASGFEYVATVPGHAIAEQQRAELAESGQDPDSLDTEALLKSLPTDPNIAIVEALSDAEQEQYSVVKDDCFWETYKQAWGIDPVVIGENFERDAEEIAERIASDPRTLDAESDVLDCVAAAGFPFISVEDIYTFPARRSSEVVDEIRKQGSEEVRADDPLWAAYQRELEGFQTATRPCTETFDERMRVLFNEYYQPGA